MLSNKGYQSFLDSYSSFNSPSKEVRDHSKMRYGYGYGLILDYDYLAFDVGFINYTGLKQKFEIAQGTRTFQCKLRVFKTDSSIQITQNDKTNSYLGAIIGIGNTAIESSFKYPNNTRSLGSEKELNGIFDAFTSELGLEYKLNYALNTRVNFYARAALSFTAFVSQLEFHSFIRSVSSTYPMEYLPVDYGAYVNGGYAYNYDDEYVKPNALKFEMQIGLSYNLINTK